MATKRFSKDSLRESIQLRIDAIQTVYGFDPTSGTIQIESICWDSGQSSQDTSVAYGKLISLISLANEVGISVCAIPAGFIKKPITGHRYRWVRPV